MIVFQKLRSFSTRVFGRVAGDQGGVDRADGYARDPVRVQVGLGQRLVDAGLVGAESAAALQEQGDAFEVGSFARATLARSCGAGSRAWTFIELP